MTAKGILVEPLQTPLLESHPTGERLVSVVVPVVERVDDLVALYHEFAPVLAARGERFEFLFVFDEGFEPSPELLALSREIADIHLLRFAQRFRETAALRLGIERSRDEVILTLPAYPQVRPEGLGPLPGSVIPLMRMIWSDELAMISSDSS